jgi:hypothetical protein
MKFKFFFTLVLIFLLVIICAHQAAAKTILTQPEDYSYQIQVKIVFDFSDIGTESSPKQLLFNWQKAMASTWNQTPTIKYNFDLQIMKANEDCNAYPDFHCIKVINDEKNQRGNIADTSFVSVNSNQNGYGEWSKQMSNLSAAHEVGHLMGLKDEYHYAVINSQKQWVNDNYKKNGPQSIMAQTWGEASALLEHLSQILKQAQQTDENLIFDARINLSQNLDYYFAGTNQKVYLERPEVSMLKGVLIKGQTDTAVYLVDQTGKLRHLANETIAAKLAGPDWSGKIIWFSDAIIYTYQFGEPIQ